MKEDKLKKIEELLSNKLDVNKLLNDIFERKSFKASVYLIKYIDKSEEKYFNMFLEMFQSMSFQEQIQTLYNVSAYLEEQKKKMEQDKVKVKSFNE